MIIPELVVPVVYVRSSYQVLFSASNCFLLFNTSLNVASQLGLFQVLPLRKFLRINGTFDPLSFIDHEVLGCSKSSLVNVLLK